MLDKESIAYLKSIYYDPKHKASLSGIGRLYSHVKEEGKFHLTKKEVTKFLQSQEVYSTHVEKKRPKYWAGVVTPYPGNAHHL